MSITKRALAGQVKIPKEFHDKLDSQRKYESEHIAKNDQFIDDYFDEWNRQFFGFSIQEIYDEFKFKGYKKSYYNKLSSQLGGKEELLKFLLVSCKRKSLMYLGYSENEILEILQPFRECGKYMVPYKNSKLTFSSTT